MYSLLRVSLYIDQMYQICIFRVSTAGNKGYDVKETKPGNHEIKIEIFFTVVSEVLSFVDNSERQQKGIVFQK